MSWNEVIYLKHSSTEVHIKQTSLSLKLFSIISLLILHWLSLVIHWGEGLLPYCRCVSNPNTLIIVMHMILQVRHCHPDSVKSLCLLSPPLLPEMTVFHVFLEMHLCVSKIILLLHCVVVNVQKQNWNENYSSIAGIWINYSTQTLMLFLNKNRGIYSNGWCM